MLVNIARFLSLDSESALRKTNRKFKRRFQWMEERLRRRAAVHNRPAWPNWKNYGSSRSKRKNERDDDVFCRHAGAYIRKCESLEEMQAAFALQKEVWNFNDAELVPSAFSCSPIKSAATSSVPSSERDGRFRALGPWPAQGNIYLHSHMLAVRKQYRNAGWRRIKLFQREDALARGFDLMEWTFDPLEIKKGYLNIESWVQ